METIKHETGGGGAGGGGGGSRVLKGDGGPEGRGLVGASQR